MASQKTYTEELQEKESSFGKIFKVSGPRNISSKLSRRRWENGWF